MGPKTYRINEEELTVRDIAWKMRKEGKLGTRSYYDPATGLKCAEGVLTWGARGDLSGVNELERDFRRRYNLGIPQVNDGFRGSSEERAEYMARLFEGMEENNE